MKTLKLILCTLALIFPLVLAFPLQAQQTASIGGTVTDNSGGVTPGASVTVTSSAGAKQTVTTDEQGAYLIKNLAPGSYDVSVQLQGFKEFISKGFAITAGQNARLDAVLQPAEATATVTVSGGNAAQVETESSQVSGTITQKEVTAVGLNGRNFTQLIALVPGVSNQTGQDEALVGAKGSVKYSVNGGRVEYNSFLVDNSDVLNAGINGNQSTLMVYPSLDAIAEVKVLTSNYGAMYGRSASGTVLVTTKSGGSQFHGNGYEFIRNEFFNARNFFDITPKAPLYRRNDFGFTLGGPLFIPHLFNTKKDNTFFFFSEEVRLEKTPQQFNQAVPSVAERNGSFADVCPFAEPGGNGLPGQQVLFKRSQYPDCPQSAASDTAGYVLTFPGNQVPIDPNAQILLNTGLIPGPTSTTGCTSTIASCYDQTVSPSTYWREELFRIDHNFSANTTLSFRYIHDEWSTVTATPQYAYLQNSFPTVENKFYGPGISLIANLTNIFSPTLVNTLSFGYVDQYLKLTPINGPGADFSRPDGLTVGYLFNNGFGGKAPGIAVAGNNTAYGGFGFNADPGFAPWTHTNPTYEIREALTKVVNKHTIQAGVDVIFAQRNEINPPGGTDTGGLQGLFTFNNQNSLFTTGNAFADFLAGNVQTFQQDSAQFKYYNRYTIWEPWVQDDWKATPRLTVNIGIRFSEFGLWHEKYNNAFNWEQAAYNPAIAPQVDQLSGLLIDPATQMPIPINLNNLDPRIINGIVQCGVNNIPAGCAGHGPSILPAPRIGFAWDPFGSGKMSIRGGYGIFYEHGTGYEANTGSLEGNAPLVLDMTQYFPFGYACVGGVGAGCGASGAYPLNVTSIPTKTMWPYTQQWSLSIQREFLTKWVASLAYVGSKGTHLPAALQINSLPPVFAGQNPFLPGQAITTAICNTYDGASFTINGNTLSSSDPGYVNLQAACSGIPGGKIQPNVNSLRQFAPGLASIYSLQNIANSTYNAMQATLRRTVGPLILNVAYTYSHSLDDSSDRFDSTFVDAYDLQANKASSSFDQRHLLNISYVYDFSFRRLGNMFSKVWDWENDQDAANTQAAGSSGWRHKVFDDWELSGITSYQSGSPFSIINGASGANGISVLDNAGVANGSGTGVASYPDVVGNPYGGGTEIVGGNNFRSFGPILGNPDAFAAPTGLTFGDAGRNSFNNPSRLNFDAALLKNIKTSATTSLELRAEVFNVFNHTQFQIFDPSRGNTGSNTISCYGGPSNAAGFVGGGIDCLTGNSFLHPVDAHRPRTMQFGAKFSF